MDSRCWHCGLANSSEQRRALLVLSFAAPGEYPEGSTYSMLPHLEGRHTLSTLRSGADF